MFKKRTDLALELRDMHSKDISGIRSDTYKINTAEIAHIRVLNDEGAAALEKPIGSYVTISLPPDWLRDSGSVLSTAGAIARELTPMLPRSGCILVVGLGNRQIIADAIGPETVLSTIVTRHLLEQFPDDFAHLRSVCAVSTGVLGLTGVETAEIVKGVCERVHPCAVIAVDALCSLSAARLCRTFQISDTGITPGGGVAGGRTALDESVLGIPVLAIGVPTVVDASTLASDLTGHDPSSELDTMLVTPKDIDALVKKSAKAIGYGINLALHGNLSAADMEQFLN